MANIFFPNVVVDSIAQLDVDFFKKHHIKGVMFDIDNTLVTHTTYSAPREIVKYFDDLQNAGIKVGIVSNNKRERVEKFCRNLSVPYAYRAYKPMKGVLRAMQLEFDLRTREVCLVGDQIFTDIYGANRMRFLSVLVTALGENETGFVAFKRVFEKAVLKKYKQSQKV